MTDIKSVIAKNIVALRQANGMTQLELAERLNYSDKAVSKWEHADSMPDISVLVELSDLFGVSLDYMVKDEHPEQPIPTEHKKPIRNIIVTAVSILAVWFVAVAVFVFIANMMPDVKNEWLAFIYAVPVSAVVWLVLNSIWFNRRLNYVIVSVLMWSALASIYLTLLTAGLNFWMVYLLGIPGQVIILLLSLLKKATKK